jgi:D-alanyl-D-alanine carboxypeptidase/D-alanyl-D-alanine-endopeptidase (penicillin-binding protein 4)
LRRLTAGFVVLLLVLAGVSYWFDLGPRWFGLNYPSPVNQPAEVPPPPGLQLPTPKVAAAVASPEKNKTVDPQAVRKALAHAVRDRDLGKSVAVQVAQLSNGRNVYSRGPDRITPASTMKLLTTTAALEALGPDHRFQTQVVARRTSNRIVLVGGGDPLLSPTPDTAETDYPVGADLRTLAKSTVHALKESGRTKVRIGYDTSLFTGPSTNPRWPRSYVPDGVVSHISPLWVDEGRTGPGSLYRSNDPALAAAQAFRKQLAKSNIKVVGRPKAMAAAGDAQQLARVQSAPLAGIVQHILEVSDNDGAEILARQVAVKEHEPGSFAGGVQGVRKVLSRLGVDLAGDRFYDGSGLSRQDRLRPATLLAVLGKASSPQHPELRAVTADLPVAGFTGSLAYRFETAGRDGLGRVRAKTGTLTGVSGLAGTVTSRDGAVMAFVAVADRIKLPHTLGARAALDNIASALAGCRCTEKQTGAGNTP